MLNKFLDRLNTNPKNSPKQSVSRVKTPSPCPQHIPNQSRINSLSPPNSHNPPQFQFSRYSPTALSSKKPSEIRRVQTNPSTQNVISGNKFNESQARIVNAPAPEISSRDKPKKTPNFEFRPLDKDSLLGSITENIKEGSILAQNVPATKTANISKLAQGSETQIKLPESRIHTNPRSPGLGHHQPTTSEKRQQAWQEWWSERKKANQQLLQAVQCGDLATCRKLLENKTGDLTVDINTKAENDWTPLHFACLSGNSELAALLIGKEANIDSETTLKLSPLHITAQKGYDEIAHLLINAGADINCKDIYNNTPLHYAAQNNHKTIAKILLSRPSIDFNLINNEKKLPSDLAKDKDLKKLFETFMSEKNLLNSKFVQRITIQDTKSESIKKMFENVSTNPLPGGYSPIIKQPLGMNINSDNVSTNVYNQTKAHYSGAFNPLAKDKLPSTVNTSGDNKSTINTSDSEISNNGQANEEEKPGPHSFAVHTLLGKGSFGEVYLVEKKDTGKFYAMKVLDKSKITRHNLTRYALTERNVLSLTNHPFIVSLDFAFQTTEKLFLILDYCPGGDLGEHLQRERRFSEERARIYLAEILLALEDLHKRDIIFRDLKPDNIVLDAEGHAMLTDFGLSKEGVLEHAHGAGSFCGSVAYLAPEMLKRVGHGKAVDWYLLGVVFYEMLVGVPPYYANNREQLFTNIQKAALKIPSYLSPEAKSLLKGLLQRNPVKRLGSGKGDAEEIKSHKFFESLNWKDVQQRKLKPPVPPKKMKLYAKVPMGIFGTPIEAQSDQDRINGWSFVAPKYQNQQENLTSKI